VWDKRWRFIGPDSKDLHGAALGPAGLLQCPVWRETKVPRTSLMASPAVWRGEVLVAAPLAGLANGWEARLAQGEEDFFASILTH
jgi:tRNA(Ile)-lysidine synthase